MISLMPTAVFWGQIPTGTVIGSRPAGDGRVRHSRQAQKSYGRRRRKSVPRTVTRGLVGITVIVSEPGPLVPPPSSARSIYCRAPDQTRHEAM